MGVYSLEAAERLAAKNKDTELLDESYMPYENPILELGIMNLREDFAMFEAMLEMDFGEYYQSLNEADDDKDNAPTPTPTQEKREADAYAKEQEEEAKAKNTAEKNAKSASMNANLAKMKNVSGMLRKIGETIKKIWEAFKRGVMNLFNRFFQSYDTFLQDKGGKFDASVANLAKHNLAEFEGKVKVYDIDDVIGAYDKIETEWRNLSNTGRTSSPVEIKGNLEDLDKKIEEAKNGYKEVSATEALPLIKKAQGGIKSTASSKKDTILRAADEMEREMSQETAQAKLDKGDEADTDQALQQKREVTQLLVNFGNKLANAYASSLANASASAYAAAAKINGHFAGKNMVSISTKEKVDAAKAATSRAGQRVKDAAEQMDPGMDTTPRVENIKPQNASADLIDEDDVFTEAELCEALGSILEDNAMIEFEECFDF